jgi:hypothetical protein
MLSGVLGSRSQRRRPAAGEFALSLLGLTIGGFGAFCGIERLEGHAPDLAPSLFLYLAAAAALVACGSRLVGAWLAKLGGGLAGALAEAAGLGLGSGRGIVRLRLPQPVFANATLVRGTRRGRAPPVFER